MVTPNSSSILFAILLVGCSRPPGSARADSGTAATRDPATPVARIDGQVITEGEVAAEAREPLAAAEARHAEEVHALKASALEELITRRLLEAQARKEGITVDGLLQREVTSKVPTPPESYLKAVYDQTKANGRVLPPFPEVRGEIEEFVRSQSAQDLRQAYIARLRAAFSVEVLLPAVLPPRLAVKADGPWRGVEKAPVTIVEFSDYECEFCEKAEPATRKVLDEYPDRVRIVFRNFPLSIHPHAQKAAEAALCAGEQGRYWEMHDLLFANQKALEPARLKQYARSLGLDPGAFDRCLDSGSKAAAVGADRHDAESLGVVSTPSFFINGRLLMGAQPFEKFKEIIDAELATSKR